MPRKQTEACPSLLFKAEMRQKQFVPTSSFAAKHHVAQPLNHERRISSAAVQLNSFFSLCFRKSRCRELAGSLIPGRGRSYTGFEIRVYGFWSSTLLRRRVQYNFFTEVELFSPSQHTSVYRISLLFAHACGRLYMHIRYIRI